MLQNFTSVEFLQNVVFSPAVSITLATSLHPAPAVKMQACFLKTVQGIPRNTHGRYWKSDLEGKVGGAKTNAVGFFFFFNSCTLLFLKFHLFIFAMLGLHCGPQAFSSCSAWGVTLHRVCGLLTPLLPWALGCVGFRGSPQMKSLSLPAPPNVGLHQIHSIHLNH